VLVQIVESSVVGPEGDTHNVRERRFYQVTEIGWVRIPVAVDISIDEFEQYWY
jgi:hypothetical protein